MSIKKPMKYLKDNYYLSVKATFNRCVLRMDLTFSRDDAFLISAGNLFHKVEAATLNSQTPYDLSRDIGTCNIILPDYRSYYSLYEM